MSTTRLTLTRPDDWHLHLRDGDLLASVPPDAAQRFARAIVMSNLEKLAWTVPGEVRFGKETGVPLRTGATVA